MTNGNGKRSVTESRLTWIISLVAIVVSVGSVVYQQAVINTRLNTHVEQTEKHEGDREKRERARSVVLAMIGEGFIPPKVVNDDLAEIKEWMRSIDQRLRTLEQNGKH